jgi:hypothetical protein
MRKHYWIATVALCIAPLLALAQQDAKGHGSLQELSVIAPGSEPEVIAQSIVIFIPAEDVPAILPGGSEDKFIKGRIASVERGEVPGAIVKHAGVLFSELKAGVPMKMYLMREPARDAYYPIYLYPVTEDTAALEPAQLPEISVQVTTPLGAPAHAAPLDGVPYTFGAEVRIPAGETQAWADLYFGVMLPDGENSVTWVNAAGTPGIREGMSPLLEDILLGEKATINTAAIFGRDLSHTFSGDEPPGMYLVFVLLVVAGSEVSDPVNWLAVETAPLFVE